ncbi:MAG: ABC transporter permease [Candidatus Hodarchaeales archaeon]|jgi:ABC-2 type transport system permease protein
MNLANKELITITKWNQGFDNLFWTELSRWFKRKVFLTRLLIWSGFSNGMALLIWFQNPDVQLEVILVFGIFAGLASSIGIIIIMQESIVGEIKSSTASWILSKPITRESYILAKWFGNSIGAIISMILIPTAVFYSLFFLFTGVILNLIIFPAVVAVLSLNMLFYLTFTLMMGSFQRNSSLVIGVPVAYYLFQQMIVNFSSFFIEITPWSLSNPLNDGTPSIVVSIILSSPVFSILPIITTAIGIIILLVFTIFIIQKQDL